MHFFDRSPEHHPQSHRGKNPNRRAVVGLLLLTIAAMIVPSGAAINSKQFRIGYQKAANTLVLLKAHGTLEQRLRPLGVEVTWLEFTAGPQLLEGLNVGSIDFGYVGEVPPVFALAAGANFVYTAYELPTPEAEGILVSKDSPIDPPTRSLPDSATPELLQLLNSCFPPPNAG